MCRWNLYINCYFSKFNNVERFSNDFFEEFLKNNKMLKETLLLVLLICFSGLNIVFGFAVSGKVNFHGNLPDTFPNGTWLLAKVEDTSIMDVASIVLGETKVDVSGYKSKETGKAFPITYLINDVKSPTRNYFELSVSVHINVGWEASGDEWLRKGDYMTDTMFRLTNFKKDDDDAQTYTKDVYVIQYL